ncbi:hypothetical protein [Raoultella sp. C349492]|uniref:hypothetical protein n=1 Tax=Raoultella sp. C349492 TaxID=2970253 RepID=UPI0035C6DD46
MNRRGLIKKTILSFLLYGYSSKRGSNAESLCRNRVIEDEKCSMPEMFGAKVDGDFNNKKAIEDALLHSYKTGLPCVFSNGLYNSDDIEFYFPVSIIIENGSFLNFSLTISGHRLNITDTVRTVLGWEECPSSKDSFPLSLGLFRPGDIIALQLDDEYGGNAKHGNENGLDILEVKSSNTSTISFRNKTRLAYSKPSFGKLNQVTRINGSLDKGAKLINGNFEGVFSVGDILRIENIDGKDSVSGSKFYFEYIKVKQIVEEHMILESRTIYSYENPWVIGTGFLRQVHITGNGGIKKLVIRNSSDVIITSLSVKRLIVSNCYGLNISNVKSEGLQEPSTINITYCFGKSIINNLTVSNSLSVTDNAALKIMSSPQLILSDIIISDSNSSSKKQSNYCLFVDAFYTPYLCWNDNIIVSNVICEKPNSNFSRGAWFYGLRNSIVDSIVGTDVFFQGSVDTMFERINIPGYSLEIKDLIRCTVHSKCSKVLFQGGQQNILNLMYGNVKDKKGLSKEKIIKFTYGKINPETGVNYSKGESNFLALNGQSWISENSYPSISIEYQDKMAIDTGVVSNELERKIFNIGSDVSILSIKDRY